MAEGIISTAICLELSKVRELTTNDIRHRLKDRHGHKVSHDQVTDILFVLARTRQIRAVDHIQGIPIWRLRRK